MTLSTSVRLVLPSEVRLVDLAHSAAERIAELTEALFGRNDYFPFTADELQAHDPVGYRAVHAAWYGDTSR